jgi:ribosomal protein S18 acetylase RimI-like enzyme
MQRDRHLIIREAHTDDLPAIVAMLADDPLGAGRENYETPLPASYHAAFRSIADDPHNELVVATLGGKRVGCLQLTFIPYLTYRGGWRALVEGVRVRSDYRGRGIGRKLFEWALQRARHRGCHLVQLTTDKQRPEAIAFYRSLGFVASHEGMKRHLGS